MQKPDVVICIGNGTELASSMARRTADSYGIRYYGVLESATTLVAGGYHTSIYDIKLPELVNKLAGRNNVKVVVLDQDQTCYNDVKEFYDTIELAQSLVDYFWLKKLGVPIHLAL